jgi:hypothetical protein
VQPEDVAAQCCAGGARTGLEQDGVAEEWLDDRSSPGKKEEVKISVVKNGARINSQ